MDTDREVLRDLYQRYASRVFQRCRYLLRNDEDARDAMHDVFIKVLGNLDGFRGQASPLTWVTRIATNHCLNILRSRRARWHDELRDLARVAEQARESEHVTIERLDLLHAILARCDAKMQELAVYYFVDEMTQDEIAELVGLSVPTLRKRLRQFMRLARRELTRALPGVQLKEVAI